MFSPRLRLLAVAATLVVISATPSSAAVIYTIDLTKAGSSGTSQGATFAQTDQQPTGTGYIDPFVRIQQTGTERGYNTDGQIQFETKDQGGHNWTHSLLLSNLSPVVLNGVSYYQFLLDINESANDANRLLSMNDFRVYLGTSGSLGADTVSNAGTGFNDGFGQYTRKVYDIDKAGDTTVELDYKLNSGSGSGDMYAYVPVSYFQGYAAKYQYVYLYSSFGQPNRSNAGFEEWAAKTKTPPSPDPNPNPNPGAVPAPPGVLLGALGVACCFLGRLRRPAAVPTT